MLGIFESCLVPAKLNLGHLKKLKEIELRRNKIPELGDDWLSNDPPSLEIIVIQANNITKIGNNAFSQLNHLGALYLTGNRFGNMKRSMFPITADRLKTLFLE